MLEEKDLYIQIIGCLLKQPSILGQTDKYALSLTDFHNTFYRKVFGIIFNLYERGAKSVSAVDIENVLKENPTNWAVWEKENGHEFLDDAETLSDLGNFDYYYNRMKKVNLLFELKKLGYDTSRFYVETIITDDDKKINELFDALKPQDIVNALRRQITGAETRAGVTQENKVETANFKVAQLIQTLKNEPDTGARLQGKIFNTMVRGARKGKFYLRTASSGIGKSRTMVGDACYLAYPIRYDNEKQAWEWAGACEKVLYIATEQELDEIQTMIVAYLSGVNENKILFGTYDSEEEKRIQKAIWLMDTYSDNLTLARMANPNISQLQYMLRQQVLENDIGYVFYDYIFSNPALLNEFRDLRIREDVALGLMGSALKDLAVELNVFILSSTQTNAQVEDGGRQIKNESVIRGARSLADKADMGCIMARPTDEEIHKLKTLSNIRPNLVTDIYKMRRGKYTQVRIWSLVDLGTCRRTDLFATDQFFKRVDIGELKQEYVMEDTTWNIQKTVVNLNTGEILPPVKKQEKFLITDQLLEKIQEKKGDPFVGLI